MYDAQQDKHTEKTVSNTVGSHKPSLLTPLNFKSLSSPTLLGSKVPMDLQFYPRQRAIEEQNSLKYFSFSSPSPLRSAQFD